ncbi:MAG: hypothetical protein J6C44_08380 [Muribaculaceae bacterium]|nr:hypothetical protein [Muribaculaceae bacterium]
MKLNYKTLMIALGIGAAMTSCAKHDIIGEIAVPGQKVPTCYWEVGSTVCKAGESFTFQGKYTVDYEGATPDHSIVWYRVNREDAATASVALAGATMSYSKTYSANDTMRAYQPIVTFSHSLAQWVDGHNWAVSGEVPVSRTLSPVTWKEIPTWDQEKFDSYYPAGFAQEFNDAVIDLLTKDSTYYSALRTVYINRPFTEEQINAVNAKYGVNLPIIDNTKEDGGAADRSDAWFYTTVASDADIIGYYYIETINEVGYYRMVAKEDAVEGEDGMYYNGVRVYPTYNAADWVFCRYDDNTGSIISTVKPEWMPAFKDLLTQIAFSEWIYDSSNQYYRVDFSRKYSLSTQFRVYDSNGQEGIATDVREISIN